MKRRVSAGGKASTKKRPKTQRRTAASTKLDQADLQKQLDQTTARLVEAQKLFAEAIEQQAATSEVLKLISSSLGELKPVFDVLLENAVKLCGAKFGVLYRFHANAFHPTTTWNIPGEYATYVEKRGPFLPQTGNALDRMLRTKALVHSVDEAAEKRQTASAKLGGARSQIIVPMLKHDELIGAITVYRQEVRPFSERQIALLTNFAAQAVIAIENARLLNELRQRTDDLSGSLEQQTATSEVLKVISSSPGELEPVFQSMLLNATRVCEAKFGTLYRYDDGAFQPAAMLNAPSAYSDFVWQRGRFLPEAGNALDRLLQTKQLIPIIDDAAEQLPTPSGKLGGARSYIAVPMLKESELVGAFIIYRQEVRPFTDKQIELVQNFAVQAVIAIENARLLNELRQRTDDLGEALEQQTATSEVLKVISSSPGELKPVFEAMLDNAVRICEATFGVLNLHENGAFRMGAMHNVPSAFAEFLLKNDKFEPVPGSLLERVMRTKKVFHTDDNASEAIGRASTLGGSRSSVLVPMLKDDVLVGSITIYRQEVRPFTPKQIELLQNFAAQAVIAIENARLLGELRQRTEDLSESLEQQTATSEVLRVISSSPGDLEPVFQAMLENATRICDAKFGTLFRFDGEMFHRVAGIGTPPALVELQTLRGPFRPEVSDRLSRILRTKGVDRTADELKEPNPGPPATYGGARSIVAVPMLKDNELVGAIIIYRQEVRPFTDKQVELVQNFAAQAVIAIENTRLLSELRESLQQQTATSDVLKVISRSTFDLETVLDTLLKSAARLCDADMGTITQRKGEKFYRSVSYGFPTAFLEYVKGLAVEPARETGTGRALLERRVVHIPDVQADPEYTWEEAQQLGGFRTMLGVPMLREGVPVGVMALTRTKVRPFTDKQIELVSTFADQAAIAIENVRLFDEIQATSRQLEEASKHKSQFLANMSHELRTPLNAIIGYTELILDGIYGETPEKANAVLKRVESNGRHLLGLINDVLDFSKIEAGQLKLSIAQYSIKDVVHNVFSAVEPLATKKNLNFNVVVPHDIQPAHGDERKLTQVLLNLVGNAIKFTDAGEVSIRVAPANGSLSVAVHDTGPGIDPANQEKLFEEFQQADNSITKAKGGTGLGLAISRRIVEMHGGRLWVDSSPGHGSVFKFEIPLVVEPPSSS